MEPGRLLERITKGHYHNIHFRDLCGLVEALGFQVDRTEGSHRVFVHPRVPRSLPLQPARGRAKPYQARQVLQLIARYNLRLEAEP
jgi:hypothetical protein